MSARKRHDTDESFISEEELRGNMALRELLEQHIAENELWRKDWEEHRDGAKKAMERVASLNTALSTIADNIAHLQCLPQIQAEMKCLNNGLSAQNSSLISQADKLITPAQQAQSVIYKLLFLLLLMAGGTMAVVLLRETNKTFKASLSGFEMGATTNHQDEAPVGVPHVHDAEGHTLNVPK